MTQVFILSICTAVLTGCSLVTPTCRSAVGPAQLNIQGGATGGSVLAKLEQGGSYRSYPAMNGVCLEPVAEPVAEPLAEPVD